MDNADRRIGVASPLLYRRFFVQKTMAIPAERLRDEANGPPIFAPPRQVNFPDAEREEIARMVKELYDGGIQARTAWNADHNLYDQMFRGNLDPRTYKPWEGAADLHVQVPYWLVDAINVRMMIGIWNQNPLVSTVYYEDDDAETADKASQEVEWHLQPARMNARSKWNRASKTRLIHGASLSLISYVNDKFKYRTTEIDPGLSSVDVGGKKVPGMRDNVLEGTFYQGPVLHPLEWDDYVVPLGCTNVQPNRPSNPSGADWVIIRQFERLSLMMKKALYGFGGDASYRYMFDGQDVKGPEGIANAREWWLGQRPAQNRAGSGMSAQNTTRERQQDRAEGINRSMAARAPDQSRKNPEYEILYYFGAYPDSKTGLDEEMVFFVCLNPLKFLGGFYLSDYYWRGERPLLEMHYQTVGSRFYSMGVMEIVKHLSAEIDTIHNMRIDVGFATNLPWFFYRASSGFNPDEIELRPLKGIPVDNVNDFAFPQMQNVTSFYSSEENLLFTLVERVMGITDLFLGVSPTHGASARHATGFVGTQMEAEARMSEVMNQDAEAFSFLCRTVYNLEIQYGPPERSFRLEGKSDNTKLKRNDLWFRGDYDFQLGANQGFFSHQIKQQQGQALMSMAQSSPLINGDMGRRWEVEAHYLRSVGFRDPETFIGPKDAVSQNMPHSQDEENGQMAQFQFGEGTPAPVHPSDNDQEHLQNLNNFMMSDAYSALGRPNMQAFMAHDSLHKRQMMSKQQQAQMQSQAAMQAQNNISNTPGATGTGANPMNRAAAQINLVPGAAGAQPGNQLLSQTGTTNQGNMNIPKPPNFGGFSGGGGGTQ